MDDFTNPDVVAAEAAYHAALVALEQDPSEANHAEFLQLRDHLVPLRAEWRHRVAVALRSSNEGPNASVIFGG